MTEAERPEIDADVERRLTSVDRRSRVAVRPAPVRRRLPRMVVTVAALSVVLIGAAIVGALLLSLSGHGPLPGAFRPTGDIPYNAGDLSRPAIAVLSDSRVLVAGGGNAILTAVLFDPATETYDEPIRDAVIRRGATATTLPNNLVLLAGGEFGQVEVSSFTTALFDPASGTVAATSPLSVARSEHTATLLDDGRVLIVGGRQYPGSGGPSDHVVSLYSVEVYDPVTGQVTQASPMHLPRAGHTATKLADGRVLIAGGYAVTDFDTANLSVPAELFDPATGIFRLVGSMITPRAGHSATQLPDGRVLIAGGTDRYDSRGERLDYIANAEVFDPKTETFSPVGPLTTERAGHSATLLPDGRVLVAGGTNDRGDPRSTEVFDPASGTFEAGPTASTGHSVTFAPLLADGRVFYPGSGPGGSEVYDPRLATESGGTAASPAGGRDAFSPVTTSALRVHPALVRLADGRVLIVGGEDADTGGILRSAEIFDPATGRATATDPLSISISRPLLTLLPDGRVLVVGDNGNGSLLGAVYDPATGSFVPPPAAVANVLVDHSLLPVTGLGRGRLVLTDGLGIEAMDAATGATGRHVDVCAAGSGIALGGDRVLLPCGDNSSATTVDLATGDVQPTAAQFVDGVSLGDHWVALTTFAVSPSGADYEYLAWVFDTSSGTLTSVDVGSESPPSGALVAIDGGRLLSFGGNGGRATTSATLFDAPTGSPREVGPMLAARSDATAIALSDGRILIVGGSHASPDRSDPPPAGAELFDPARIP